MNWIIEVEEGKSVESVPLDQRFSANVVYQRTGSGEVIIHKSRFGGDQTVSEVGLKKILEANYAWCVDCQKLYDKHQVRG